MDNVKRYDPVQINEIEGGQGYGQMEEVEDGDYVKVEDYIELANRLAKLVNSF